MKKRKDECLFCNSRKCYERVATIEDKGKMYDEIACINHTHDLHKHSDETVPGTMRIFLSSTGKLTRGDMSIFDKQGGSL